MSLNTPPNSGNSPKKPKLKLKLKSKGGKKSGSAPLSLKGGGRGSVTKPPLSLNQQTNTDNPAIESAPEAPIPTGVPSTELPPSAPPLELPPLPPSPGLEVPPAPPEEGPVGETTEPISPPIPEPPAPEEVASIDLPPAAPSLELPPLPPSPGTEVPPAPPEEGPVGETIEPTSTPIPEPPPLDEVPSIELPPAAPSLELPPLPPSPGLEVPPSPPEEGSAGETIEPTSAPIPEPPAPEEVPSIELSPAAPSLELPPLPPSPDLEVSSTLPEKGPLGEIIEPTSESATETALPEEEPTTEQPSAAPSLELPPVPLSPSSAVPSAPPEDSPVGESVEPAQTLPTAGDIRDDSVSDSKDTSSEMVQKESEDTSSSNSIVSDDTFSEISQLKAKIIILNSKIGSVEDLTKNLSELSEKVTDLESTVSKPEEFITEAAALEIIEKNLAVANETNSGSAELEKLNLLEKKLSQLAEEQSTISAKSYQAFIDLAKKSSEIGDKVTELESTVLKSEDSITETSVKEIVERNLTALKESKPGDALLEKLNELETSIADNISKVEDNKKSILSIIDKFNAFENEATPQEGLSKDADELRAIFADLEEKLSKVVDEQSAISAKVLELEEIAEDAPPPPPPADLEISNDSLSSEIDKLSEKFEHLSEKFEKFNQLQESTSETNENDSVELIQEELDQLKAQLSDETEARQENKKVILTMMDELHGLKNALEEKQNNDLSTEDDSPENTNDISSDENLSKPSNQLDSSLVQFESLEAIGSDTSPVDTESNQTGEDDNFLAIDFELDWS